MKIYIPTTAGSEYPILYFPPHLHVSVVLMNNPVPSTNPSEPSEAPIIAPLENEQPKQRQGAAINNVSSVVQLERVTQAALQTNLSPQKVCL